MQKLLVLTAVVLAALALTLASLASKPAPPTITISFEDLAAMP